MDAKNRALSGSGYATQGALTCPGKWRRRGRNEAARPPGRPGK
jgi:hypothetical protein